MMMQPQPMMQQPGTVIVNQQPGYPYGGMGMGMGRGPQEVIIEKQGLFGGRQEEIIMNNPYTGGKEVIIEKTGPFGLRRQEEIIMTNPGGMGMGMGGMGMGMGVGGGQEVIIEKQGLFG